MCYSIGKPFNGVNVFQDALKAKLPIIGVTTDDLVNIEEVLIALSGKTVAPFPAAKTMILSAERLYWTVGDDLISPETYRRVLKDETQLVVVNIEKPNPLVVDCGQLPTPEKFVRGYLSGFLPQPKVDPVLRVLKGCSVKTMAEIVQLASAMYGEITPKSVTAVRMRLNGATPGLYPLDLGIGYWQPQKDIEIWMGLNESYMRPELPPDLHPKGLLLHGKPGTGKSMAAKVVARHFGVPAFRLDIPSMLNRYIGESESRLQRNLDLLTQYSPCVVLIDEVEKTFNVESDQQTTSRMMGQLLWWLQERRSPCPVIMTTNNRERIPPELYRDGRLDLQVKVEPLDRTGARHLAQEVLKALVGDMLPKQIKALHTVFGDPEAEYIPAQVHSRVVAMIKENQWMTTVQSSAKPLA